MGESGGPDADAGIREPDLHPRDRRRLEAEAEAQASVSFPVEHTRVSGRRFAAHLLDGVVYGIVFLLVVAIASVIGNWAAFVAIVILILPGPVLYYVLTERSDGRSPGKAMMGIKVVDAEGRVPGTGDLVRRTIPLLFEYFYVIALVAILSSPTRQRLGDRWAGTYVIDDEARKIEARAPQAPGGPATTVAECAQCGEVFASDAELEAHSARFHPGVAPA